jgi:hypothetical protein
MDRKDMCLDFVDWSRMDQDRNQWRALVNSIMNF